MRPHYSPEFRRSAEKELGKLAGRIRARILRRCQVAHWRAWTWRLRIDDYRVVQINDTDLIVLVVRVAHHGLSDKGAEPTTISELAPDQA